VLFRHWTFQSFVIRIFSHSSLRIESDDSFFELIVSLCSSDEVFYDLIEFVEAQCLSDSCMNDYISFLDCDCLRPAVLSSICRRLSLRVSPPIRNPRVSDHAIDFPFDPGQRSTAFSVIYGRNAAEIHIWQVKL
jgi:hypothetical protein